MSQVEPNPLGNSLAAEGPRSDESEEMRSGQGSPRENATAEAPSHQASTAKKARAAQEQSEHRMQYASLEEGLRLLPSYSRSLLKIKLPAVVTLALTKQPLRRILELGPGSLIQFDKSCDETLTLEIGDQEVALGEAVKVGEKFGLRVTSMVLPEERFRPVRNPESEPPSDPH